MTISDRNNPDDDSTKVMYTKADSGQETVIIPGRGSTGPVAGKVIGIAGGKAGDNTVFVPAQLGAQPQQPEQAFEPVVGWVVVTDGPGKGHFRPMYYGLNSIGRGEDLRIVLDFNDQRISREAHAFLIYDEIERKFFVKDNGKSNIVRLNGNMVLTPTEMHDRDVLTIGQTTLLFIALCNEKFDWLGSNAPTTA